MENPKQNESAKKASGIGDKLEIILNELIGSLNWKKGASPSPNDQLNIMDYGCGPGKAGFNMILPKVLDYDGSLYSVDISDEMINYARNNFNHENIVYAVGNILEEFPFQNVQFDIIISMNVFHYIPDLKPALQNFSNILKPNGQLCFSLSPISNDFFYKPIMALAKREEWKEYFIGCEQEMPLWTIWKDGDMKSHIKNYFEDAGFTWVKLEVISIPMTTYITHILEFVVSVTPCIARIPAELQAKVRQDMRDYITTTYGFPMGFDMIRFDTPYVTGIVQKS